jgi:cytosine/adenosine deaminase-related metal-dependent hydrolase
MRIVRAAWVCPISAPPLRDGWVAIDGDRIAGVGRGAPPGPAVDLGDVALLPSLVNAHVHLELSWLRDRVPPATAFTSWVKGLFAVRGRAPERADDATVMDALDAAIAELRATGTGAVGDTSNSLASVAPLARAGMPAVVFHELLGFDARDASLVEATRALRDAAGGGGIAVAPAPHAPYSVSPELFRAVRAEVDRLRVPITSVHVGESEEELQLLRDGTGPWRQLLGLMRVWRDDWTPPGTGPVPYLDALGVLDARTLVVHGTQLTRPELDRLAAIGATLVTCPRSNQWVGVGLPPVAAFYEAGVAVAVGTDSLASVADLNLFAELEAMRQLAPGVPARRLLASATVVGARALGLGDELGTLEAGKRASIVAVRLPGPVADVEEHLVGGVPPARVAWV